LYEKYLYYILHVLKYWVNITLLLKIVLRETLMIWFCSFMGR